ncbi:Lar family restriction alleviation protein [Burkholderia gladioli]|uniref:Lar family restriction alleviation protein n=1 Tax=Burkholderia gladioli TaxID=28095 RepID=UPI001641B6FD|nr:Lar family restriction alleviation protein [Burkholderia gladioli]
MSDKLTHLLPCPFCGCTKVPKRQGNGIGDYWLECFDCGASTRLREDGAGMEKDWNRRASPAPAIPMPPLNDAMRAVLTNENCVYGTPDELYAALVMAAPAISESEDSADDAIPWNRVMSIGLKHGMHWNHPTGWTIQFDDALHKFANEIAREAIDAARKGEKS